MKPLYIESAGFDPYLNLALEKYLFDGVSDGEVILYLWQNERTVVCGRNQNVYKECRIARLEEDGGHLARRLSGGGAVFHDLGNLNFTFIAREAEYDLARQLGVITAACRSFGVPAQISGRNDILADGKKFSGNAFYKSMGTRYHHGTIMVDVDFSRLSDYLNVDRSKLQAKGVDSVRSRVVNLKSFNADIDISGMKRALKAAFEEAYGGRAAIIPADGVPADELESRREYFRSDEWLFGKKADFSNVISQRFAWGDFELHEKVEGGVISDAVVYSDALDEAYILNVAQSLRGARYSPDAMIAAAAEASREHEAQLADISELLRQSI